MLILLSPAKTLDLDSPLPTDKRSEPRLLDQTAQLVEVMRGKSPSDLASLMNISDELAALNASRYAEFEDQTPDDARPAVLAFAGDVYQGMDAGSFSERDFTEAQKTVRILSGLYGALRPLDAIQPYRLEMGTKLVTERGKDLYQWWDTRVTDLLRDDLAESPGDAVVVNLASVEYFSVVDTELLDAPVVSPRFEDRDKNGKPRVVSFHAKKARGMMAGWMVRERVRKVSELRQFNGGDYAFDADRSSESVPVFVR